MPINLKLSRVSLLGKKNLKHVPGVFQMNHLPFLLASMSANFRKEMLKSDMLLDLKIGIIYANDIMDTHT